MYMCTHELAARATASLASSGTGKGGDSIWGNKFPDEFSDELKVCLMCEPPPLHSAQTIAAIRWLPAVQHDKRGMMSMANNGPNTK